MIKRLDISHLPVCAEMVDAKPRTAGTVKLSKLDFLNSFGSYFSDEFDKRVCFGYFKDDELISFICQAFHHNTMRGKFWIITALYTKDHKSYFNFKNPEMGELFKYAFEYAESKGYYEFYYSVAERIMNAYERQWQRNSLMARGRYERFIVDKVPPNTKPEFELYWKLMGESLKPDTIVIKKRVLKEEFRNPEDNI